MLSGDELSIQLFIAATGFTILGIAVTQAGWTHRNFILAMFIAGCVLCAAALFWSPISKYLPKLNFLALAATSAWSWLLLLTSAFGALCWFEMRAREKWASRIPQLIADVEKQKPHEAENSKKFQSLEWPAVSRWMSPIEAIDEFVDEGLRKVVSDNSEACEKAAMELEKTSDAYRKKYPNTIDQVIELQNPTELGRRRQDAQTKYNNVQMDLLLSKKTLIDDLTRQLRNGQVVARGVPFETGKLHGEWEYLKPAFWVQLSFDPSDSNYETAKGAGRTYKGIQIGKHMGP